MTPICENLGISRDECRYMLATYGINESPLQATANDVSEAISQLTADPLQHIVDELRKTLSYIRKQLPSLAPDRLLLFGGGATIRNVAITLARSVGIESAVWQLASESVDRSESIDPSQALLGPAIALSALAGAS
jgi:actin-like ATPase involved in cell morphogenesis